MKLKVKIYRLTVKGSRRRFIVDLKFASKLGQFNWCYIPSMKRARATIVSGERRVFLHSFIANKLLGKEWQEVFFANNDPYDCRAINLRPYRREEEGARRRPFKGKAVPQKGVGFKKSSGRYYASIRVRGNLKHLGYFPDPELAAIAYRKAFKEAHPNLTLN